MIVPGLAISLCFLLTAAHYLRHGDPAAVVLCVATAALAFSRTAWIRRSITALLASSLLLWCMTASHLVQLRHLMGLPSGRLTAIMLAVIALHALALFLSRRRLAPPDDTTRAKSTVFTAVILILWAMNAFAPLPLLAGERLIPLPGVNGILILSLAWWGVRCAGGLADVRTAPARRKKLWAVFSIVFFLQFLLGLTLLPSLLMTGKLHIPEPFMMLSGPAYRGEGFFMPGLFAASVLLAGSAWCSHLCYFGVWDQASAASAGKKPKIPRHGAPSKDRRWHTLAAALLLPLGMAALGIPAATAIMAALVLLAATPLVWRLSRHRGSRTYCGTYCPMGLLASLLGKLSPWRMRSNAGKCTGCMRCAAACRDQAIIRENGKCRITSRCTLCRDCLGQCEHGALGLEKTYLKPLPGTAGADTSFIILITVMHIVFLATARI